MSEWRKVLGMVLPLWFMFGFGILLGYAIWHTPKRNANHPTIGHKSVYFGEFPPDSSMVWCTDQADTGERTWWPARKIGNSWTEGGICWETDKP